MRTRPIVVALWFFAIAFNALAKDADSAGVAKSYLESAKRERRQIPKEHVERSANWQPYLRWHRDAAALGGVGESIGANGRPFLQL